MTKRVLPVVSVAALVAVGSAACGGASKAPGVQLAPSQGATAASVAAPAVPPAPKVPPALSKKPVVTVPKGPPPNHLVVRDLIPGTGKVATPSSTVTVDYIGVLYKTGKVFDSTWKTGKPALFRLSGLIKGFSEGIAGMRVGGRRELIIPPNLGYGRAGAPPKIPANSTLVFVVDLLAVS